MRQQGVQRGSKRSPFGKDHRAIKSHIATNLQQARLGSTETNTHRGTGLHLKPTNYKLTRARAITGKNGAS